MALTRKKKTITAVQIVLAVLVACGAAWLAYKVVGYSQAQQVYHQLESAYASEPVDDDPASIDFPQLQADLPATGAWLVMDDVDISYPVMQGQDNEYYLHYDPTGEPNIDGSIFFDYRTTSVKNDLHVLVYGHNMRDESMFGQLDNYLDPRFYEQGTGGFTIFTPEGAYRYQIFAVDVVDPADEVYQMGYANTQVFAGFVKRLKERSIYDTGVSVSGSDHVVTLSTCSSTDRLVLSAKRV